MAQAWLWPPNGQSVFSVSAALLGTETVVFDVFNPRAYPFNPNGGAIALVGANKIVSSAVAADGSVTALDVTGKTYSLPASGGAAIEFSLPADVYTANALCNGITYSVTTSGLVYDQSGNSAANFGTYVNALTVSGTNLVALCPTRNNGAAIGISAGATGAPTYVAVPQDVASPTCCAATPQTVAVGGWGAAAWSGNYATLAVDPVLSTQIAAAGGGQLVLYRTPNVTSDAWASAVTLSGVTSSPVAMAWASDGTQILLADTANSAIQIVGYTAGVLSVNQTVAFTSATCVATTDSTHALAGGNDLLAPLVYVTSWSVVAANVLSVPGVSAIVALSSSSAIAACNAGIVFLAYVSGGWIISSTVSVGFAPTDLTVDNNGLIYAVSPGNIAVVKSGVVVGSGSWTGQAFGLAAFNGQAVTYDQGNLRVLGNASGSSVWTIQSSTFGGVGVLGLSYVNKTLFTYGSSGLQAFNFSSPYTVTPSRKGAVCLYSISGANWTTVFLTTDHVPSAMALSGSNFLVATVQNDLYTITPAGAIAQTAIIPQSPGQSQAIPLGTSALVAEGATLYAATSMAGLLVQVQ